MTETSKVRLDRGDQDFRDAKNHVYGLAHNVCINGKEQRALLETMHEVEMQLIQDGESGETIIKELLFMIMDGLQSGNWPWVVDALKPEIIRKFKA